MTVFVTIITVSVIAFTIAGCLHVLSYCIRKYSK